MAIISFYADKVRKLAQLAVDNPDNLKPCIEQRYSVDFLRDDLDPDRRKAILAEAENGFNFDIQGDEIDHLKIPAGVWLVGDEGIYMMSNAKLSAPGVLDGPIEHAVQCFETDRRNWPDFDTRYDTKRRIFGGDDSVIFLPAEFIMAATEGKQVLLIDLTPSQVKLPSPAQEKAWLKNVALNGITHYTDPDRKAEPKLWQPPAKDDSTPQP